MESYVKRIEFLQHCRAVFPESAHRLDKVAPRLLIASLSTRSHHSELCYERLEWLGDAVLKVVLSDALMLSPELGSWIRLLPEGYLSQARDTLACNATLTELCKKLGLDQFILFRSLSRGKWAPAPLCLVSQDGIENLEKRPSGKVCADVIEALIGLVYMEFGIDASCALIADMGLIPSYQYRPRAMTDMQSIIVSNRRIEAAKEFTGQEKFSEQNLVEEAFCHPTALGTRTPSYQRLEWIGDAALCLSTRDWIFKTFPDRSVGDMVRTEALLNSNETLAFLAHRKGLIKYLNHRDQTLQARLDEYTAELTSKRGGLWGTVPPKTLADVVESLIGLVHVACGFVAAQQAVKHILAPVFKVLELTPESEILVHPMSRLKELAGRLLSLETEDGDSFSKSHPDVMVWNGFYWGVPEKNKVVARVHCFGETIVATCGTSKASARAMACDLVLTVADRMPEFMDRFLFARRNVQQHVLHDKSNDDSDD